MWLWNSSDGDNVTWEKLLHEVPVGQMDLRGKGTKCSHSAGSTGGALQPQRLQGCCFIRDRRHSGQRKVRMELWAPHTERSPNTHQSELAPLSPELTLSGLEQTVLVVSWCYSNRNDPEGKVTHRKRGTHPWPSPCSLTPEDSKSGRKGKKTAGTGSIPPSSRSCRTEARPVSWKGGLDKAGCKNLH